MQLATLDRLPRTGWALRGVPAPESIAGHALAVAHLVLTLAPEVEPPLRLDRALAMALVHDAPEAWTGDLPSPHQYQHLLKSLYLNFSFAEQLHSLKFLICL